MEKITLLTTCYPYVSFRFVSFCSAIPCFITCRRPAALNPGRLPLDDQSIPHAMAAARAHGFGAIMAHRGHHLRIVVECGDHPALRADSDRSQREAEASKIFPKY